jgi:hypothetical protein
MSKQKAKSIARDPMQQDEISASHTRGRSRIMRMGRAPHLGLLDLLVQPLHLEAVLVHLGLLRTPYVSQARPPCARTAHLEHVELGRHGTQLLVLVADGLLEGAELLRHLGAGLPGQDVLQLLRTVTVLSSRTRTHARKPGGGGTNLIKLLLLLQQQRLLHRLLRLGDQPPLHGR